MRLILLPYILLFLCVSAFLLGGSGVSADVVNPEYFNLSCQPGEEEVECEYRSEEPFGPRTYDECVQYQDNPDYYYLVGRGSSFGGAAKYCRKKQIVISDDQEKTLEKKPKEVIEQPTRYVDIQNNQAIEQPGYYTSEIYVIAAISLVGIIIVASLLLLYVRRKM